MAKFQNPEHFDEFQIRNVRVGDEIKRVRYDPQTKTMYRLDEYDNWNGGIAKIDLDAITPPPAPESAESEALVTPMDLGDAASAENRIPDPEAPTEPSSVQLDPNVPTAEEPENEQKRKLSIKPFLYGIVGVAAVFAIVSTSLGGSRNEQGQTQAPQQTEPPATVITEGPATDPAMPSDDPVEETAAVTETAPEEETVSVLSVVEPIIPGQSVSQESIEVRSITVTEFWQLSAHEGVYQAEHLEDITGLTAIRYIPAGKYLTYDDIGKSYNPTNPWEADIIGPSAIVLPVSASYETLACFNWGNKINLTITVQTKQTNDNSTQETTETAPEGLEHESSVLESMVIDTYSLHSVQIKDILNLNKQSLFARYSALSTIPTAFQADYLFSIYVDSNTLQQDIPAYIVIGVTEEQAELLSNLDATAMTVAISDPVANNATALQAEVYADIYDTECVISEVWRSITEGA